MLLTFIGAALLLAHIALLLGMRLYPFVDLPNHLAAATISRFYDDPASRFAESYVLGDALAPNQVHLRFCSSTLFPTVEDANRIYHVLYLVLLAGSVVLLIRAIGGDLWAAPLALLYAYNFNVHWGFANYLPGIPAVALFCWLLVADLRRSTALSRFGLAIGLLALFFVHALIALFGLLVYGAVTLLTSPASALAWLRRSMPAWPTLAAIVLWWARGAADPEEASFFADYYASEYLATFASRAQFFFHDHVHLFYGAAGSAFTMLAPVAIFLLAYAAVAGLRRGEGWPSRTWPAAVVVFALGASAVLCGVVLPDRLPGQYFLWERFSVFFFLALVVLASRAKLVATAGVRAAIVFLCVAHLALQVDYVADFDAETREFTPEFLPDATSGARLGGVVFDYEYRDRPIYLHFPSYFIVWKRGVATSALVEFRFGWVRRRADGRPIPLYGHWAGEADYAGYCDLDYLLVRGSIPAAARRNLACFRPSREASGWALYERPPASPHAE